MDRADYQDFAGAVAGRDSDVDLFGAAMIICRLSGRPTDPHDTARRLDVLAEAVHESVGDGTDPGSLSQAIDHELFVVRGFHGNSSSYDDPENSFLDHVVEHRTGLPITLSLVYMELAQRIGLRCDGIGFPGHFIVRCGEPEAPLFVDPYHQGVRLDAQELLARLRSQPLGSASPESFLTGVTRRQILQRMLRNLHVTFRDRRDFRRWLAVIELALVIEPWNATLVGERGMVYYRMGKHEQALADLQRYIEASAPESVSAGARRLLDELRLRSRTTEGLA